MNQESIRNARIDDLDSVLRLYADMFDTGDAVPEREALRKSWESIIGSPHFSVFILERGGEPAATCMLAVVPNLTRGARPFGVIENVVTAAVLRGMGCGGRVLRHAVERAWELGCYKVMLMTGRKDERVHRFYEKAGFRRDIKQAYAMYAEDLNK